MILRSHGATLFPYTTLFRSQSYFVLGCISRKHKFPKTIIWKSSLILVKIWRSVSVSVQKTAFLFPFPATMEVVIWHWLKYKKGSWLRIQMRNGMKWEIMKPIFFGFRIYMSIKMICCGCWILSPVHQGIFSETERGNRQDCLNW